MYSNDNFVCLIQQLHAEVYKLKHLLYLYRSPKVRISPTKTHDGRPVSTNLAYFSSRGPSSMAPAVLKVLTRKLKKKKDQMGVV